MNIGNNAYDNRELSLAAERLSKCEDDKTLLELELVNEEFKYKYIPKRRALAAEKALVYFVCIGLVICVIVACIYMITSEISATDTGGSFGRAVMLVASGIIIPFCLILVGRLWFSEYKLLGKLNEFNKNTDEDKGNVSYEQEKKISAQRIELLKAQLSDLQTEIDNLKNKKIELINSLQVSLKKNKDCETADEANTERRFKLKAEKLSIVQCIERVSHYDRQIQENEDKIKVLEREDELLAKKISDINKEYQLAKKHITTFVLSVVIVACMQNIFSGKAQNIINVFLLIGFIFYLIRLISICREPIIMYMVEKRHKQIQDYAFEHNLRPLADRRKEILGDLNTYREDIRYIKTRREALIKECGLEENES